MKCGYCSANAASAFGVVFQLSTRGRRTIRICSAECTYWGGIKHVREGFATTLTSLRKVFPKSIEVVS